LISLRQQLLNQEQTIMDRISMLHFNGTISADVGKKIQEQWSQVLEFHSEVVAVKTADFLTQVVCPSNTNMLNFV